MKKNYTAAYENLNNAYSYRDSVFTEEKDRSISDLKIGYETDKKEEENKILTQDGELKDLRINQQYIIIIGLAIVLIIIIIGGFYFYRQRRIITQQREKLLEQKLLQMQLNPHFIFNSLQAIQDYIYTNNQKEASQYLSKFARLMRLTLENSRQENILLKKEIESLDNYLSLQKLRLGNKLEYAITVSDNIDPTFTEVPPCLYSPL
ncbi:MAG: histidine kinase [Sphingobacteriales bacterium JAD_PAG50586_3]|nr:MAG: histidine kinase [Sphingobacteriales bacterium JAD_PAG50586_3]